MTVSYSFSKIFIHAKSKSYIKAFIRLTFDIFLEYIINDRVNVLIYILKQEREAILDGKLQLFQEITVIKGAHLEKKRDRELIMMGEQLMWMDVSHRQI